jgi:hypothetical protein
MVFARRELDPALFGSWYAKYEVATADPAELIKMRRGEPNAIVELQVPPPSPPPSTALHRPPSLPPPSTLPLSPPLVPMVTWQVDLECELTLQGATAIEDKLQGGVPEILADLRIAGIKLWMLTGDKVGTAKNIAMACNILPTSAEVLELTTETYPVLAEVREARTGW